MAAREEHETDAEAVLDAVQNYRRGRVYTAFAELAIGDTLDGGPKPLNELADAIAADADALRRFLEAASALGIVKIGEDQKITLTHLGWRLYAPTSPESMANALRLDAAFFERWSRLTEAVRSGKRPPSNLQQESDSTWVPMFTRALYERSRETAQAVARTLQPLLHEKGAKHARVLDLGGGHGGYSVALARLIPGLRATVFDLPPVIETTSTLIAESDVSEKVSTQGGDFHVDDLGENWDFILLFGVLHGETESGAEKLLAGVRQAMSSDGILLIRSQGRSTGAQTPGERELFDLHMLLSTEGGKVHRATDIDQLLSEHGFTLDQELRIHPPGAGTILVYSLVSGAR
jgi:SAM-dependent methyltransferase